MAGRITISGTLNELPQGTISIGPITLSPNTLNQAEVNPGEGFAAGTTAISVPTFAVGVIIQPDPSNTVQLTLKGASGDTGLLLSMTAPSLFSFAQGSIADLYMTAASDQTTFTGLTWF